MSKDAISQRSKLTGIGADEWFEASKAADALALEPEPDRFSGVTYTAATMEHAARVRLFDTVPTTLEGCIAFLKYIQEIETEGGCPLELMAIAGYRISGPSRSFDRGIDGCFRPARSNT
jgi:hypothetical protein